MGKKSKWEYFQAIYQRYRQATLVECSKILDEFCQVCGYNRKYAIRKLNGPPPIEPPKRFKRKRGFTYFPETISILMTVWESADYPCSLRLKAIVAGWLPWIKKRFQPSPLVEKQLLSISARQIDRRLGPKKHRLKKQIYGRTKPGTLLKHHIPIKTDNWDVTTPGWSEIDTVSHSGNNADGLFASTVNETDILTTWGESRAVLGKGEEGVVNALDDMGKSLPFARLGLDSDNGSEFINWHLHRYCQDNHIQPFRGRPYKKDDNAHIEQKNWTHVRKLIGYDRYDTQAAVDAMNDLYKNELRIFLNLFMPSVKLTNKKRVGSRLTRKYDDPQTPFDRVKSSEKGDPKKIKDLQTLHDTLDPFELNSIIQRKLSRIYKLANHRQSPKPEKPS
jgi:hypothetical protein